MAANAASYTVKEGESFWSISHKFDVSLSNLQIANNRSGSLLYAGEMISIPNDISYEDKQLMAQLVHAEAKGEPYAGKVAVATVILNRVDSNKFPDTVEGVVYEREGGHYAFTPVKNGAINQPAGAESMKAVNEAIAFKGQGQGSLYFYNPEISTSDWIFSRDVTVTIGNHRFAK
ncbi:peptidoglycan-binding protein [Virgibacillus phasianinus]|uniref:Peptidoglycan-binding protein n=2 Tax=Virgibacillus phasianinus TaxID=2017483 RepID=A0A220U815_9BACI|nr:peptidoglycan-binding protein [Virgibacillus phasianinus]